LGFVLATNVIFMSITSYHQHAGKAGRLNQGGAIDPNEILLLEKGSNRKWQTIMAVAYHMLNL
jgi:hypothetical protein